MAATQTNETGPMFARRGTLRIYLGAAPGVGKTFAMLNEGRRRCGRGTDVVVGFVETHGRTLTSEAIGDLEIVPRRTIEHRGTTFTEMDVDAVLARQPDVALVDELAHTNVPGSGNEKRWQDIDLLLHSGIDVISTVNVQHLESLNDVVERITGIQQHETVPDSVVRAADQIELVDMDPYALRRRLAHGNVYAADKVDAALANYFREGNLTALRELALLWVAHRVDDALSEYRERHGIDRPWETRERVVVALSGAPGSDHLVRRAARIAHSATAGELIGVHVVADTGLTSGIGAVGDSALAEQRRLLDELGGEYRKVTSNDIAKALVDVARSENATQIVLGASGRSWWQQLINGSVINRVARSSGPIDVHVISPHDAEHDDRRLPEVRQVLTPLSKRRQMWGWVVVATGLPTLTVAFSNLRDTFGLTSVLLLYLVLAMVTALVGGVLPGSVAVLGGFVLANWFHTPPLYQLHIADAENLLALVVYAAAAGIVAVLVDRVGRARMRASRSQAEAQALASLAGAIASPGSLPALLGQMRTTFGFRAAALLRDGPAGWAVDAASGVEPPQTPDEGDVVRDLGGDVSLVLAGGELSSDDQRVLGAFATQLGVVAETERLQDEAGKVSQLSAANALRASLLQAVSHDLRTPLASIKASISSLRQHDIDWSDADVAEFQKMIEEETDRLERLVGNLLDMSRLQASAVTVALAPTGVEETVFAAIASLGADARVVDVEVPETLPEVVADAVLLEHALANLIGNALRMSPPETPPVVAAGSVVSGRVRRVDVRIVDRGPGIRPEHRTLVFQPFQRLVDRQQHGSGVGLGLAIARGFVETMGGELAVDDTPGGGVTMTVSLPVVESTT